jgi:hypothetical protein
MLFSLMSLGGPAAQSGKPHNAMDHFKQVVPNKETAIKVAEAIAVPIYGRKIIDDQRPLVATYSKGVWTVEGTFHGLGLRLGGVMLMQIQAKDCKVLRITHGE